MLPPNFLATLSAMLSPRPDPLPGPLVVKNGSNAIFAFFAITVEEFEALRHVANHRPISEADKARLLELALIDEKLGGLTLTLSGKVRLAYGRPRPLIARRWMVCRVLPQWPPCASP